MDNTVKTIIKFVTEGVEKATAGIDGISKAGGVATRTMSTLASSLGSAGGALGKYASGAANMIASIQQMGAMGGIIAGAQMAITAISNHFIEKADRMVEAAKNLASKTHEYFLSIKADAFKDINDQLEKATTLAATASQRFEALAGAYMKVADAKAAVAKSGDEAAIAGMTLERSRAMAAEKDPEKKALVGSEYDVKIAEMRLANTTDEQDMAVEKAKKEAKDARMRMRSARNEELDAGVAVDKAQAWYDKMIDSRNIGGTVSQKDIDEAEQKLKDAKKTLAEKESKAVSAEASLTASREAITTAENERKAAITDATRQLFEAREAEKALVAAQRDNAKAQIERAKAELAAAKAAEREERRQAEEKTRQDNASLLGQARGSFDSQFRQAFDLWRDPEAAASAVESEKKRGEDMKRFRKEVNRYGGKGKIDEYAALMRAGDEEGMQAKLEQWRKSSRFTPQTEQLVKAAAADQNRNSAERSLAAIEKNTENLAKKIDELLSVK